MTTNHRPTLESKRGKVQAINDSISHSRALPQQTQLKYRKDLRNRIDPNKIKSAVDELKQELLKDEGRLNNELKQEDDDFMNGEDKGQIRRIENEEKLIYKDKEDNNGSISNESKPESESQEESGSDSEINSESEDDSEDETAELMAELQKIKKEKEDEKQKIELEAKSKLAATSNPLVKVGEDGYKVKKSWRSNTAFRLKNKNNQENNSQYTNDTLDSEHHQDFLSKYIK